jgi:hypothetical protein
MHYGSGSVKGHLVSDDFVIQSSDNSTKRLLLKNFTFGLMEQQRGILGIFDIDCIIGLAYKTLIFDEKAQHKMSVLFDSIVQSKQLKLNTLSFSYLFQSELKYGFKPRLIIGYIDPHAYVGNMSWFPIVEQSFMSVRVEDFLFNNKSLGICGNKKGEFCHMTLDTGMTYASFPKKA